MVSLDVRIHSGSYRFRYRRNKRHVLMLSSLFKQLPRLKITVLIAFNRGGYTEDEGSSNLMEKMKKVKGLKSQRFLIEMLCTKKRVI